MPKPTITIPLDPQTARAYNSARAAEKRKMQALLSLWLQELTSGEIPSLHAARNLASPDALIKPLGESHGKESIPPNNAHL